MSMNVLACIFDNQITVPVFQIKCSFQNDRDGRPPDGLAPKEEAGGEG